MKAMRRKTPEGLFVTKKMAEEAYALAKAKGFYADLPSAEHCLMVAVGEVGELLNADRRRAYAWRLMTPELGVEREARRAVPRESVWARTMENPNRYALNVAHTVEDELADVCLTLLSFGAYWDATRGEVEGSCLALDGALGLVAQVAYYSASGSFGSVAESAYALCGTLCDTSLPVPLRVLYGLGHVLAWAEHLGVDLELHVALKMNYNKERERLHGKAY